PPVCSLPPPRLHLLEANTTPLSPSTIRGPARGLPRPRRGTSHAKTPHAPPGDRSPLLDGRAGPVANEGHAAGTLVEGEGQRVVRPAPLAGGLQLHPEHRDQPAGDVAGRHLRPEDHRPRTGLGAGAGVQQRSRVPAPPAVAAGPRRVPAARR